MAGTYVYPEEIVLRGPGQLADDLVDLGIDTVLLSVLYHPSRRIFPRYRTISCSGPGQLAIAPKDSYAGYRWRGRHDPEVGSVMAAFRSACRERGLTFRAWMVMMHQMPTATGLHDLAATYLDGTASEHALCPSNPGVAALAAALVEHVRDELEPDGFDLEAPLHSGWEPDYNLSLSTSPGSVAHAVCVCGHCRESLQDVGADAEDAIRQLRTLAWEGGGPLPTRWRAARSLGASRLAAAMTAEATSPRALLVAEPEALLDRGWSEQTASHYDALVLGTMALSGEELRAWWDALRPLPGQRRVASTNWAPARGRAAFREDLAWLRATGAEISIYNHTLLPAEALADVRAVCADERSEQ